MISFAYTCITIKKNLRNCILLICDDVSFAGRCEPRKNVRMRVQLVRVRVQLVMGGRVRLQNINSCAGSVKRGSA